MSPGEKFGGFSHGGEIERSGDMPSTSDLEGMEGVGIGNTVQVGFPLGGKAGVEAGFFTPNAKNADPCG